jgi:hypothetical protein
MTDTRRRGFQQGSQHSGDLSVARVSSRAICLRRWRSVSRIEYFDVGIVKGAYEYAGNVEGGLDGILHIIDWIIMTLRDLWGRTIEVSLSLFILGAVGHPVWVCRGRRLGVH